VHNLICTKRLVNKFTEAKKSLMGFLVHNLICTKRYLGKQVH
jgi:hypothetical protein